MKSISIKRVYDHKSSEGTYRVLVDRLWPRGVKKEDLEMDEWNKEVAPSTDLRKWFDHKEERFEEFIKKYQEELKEKKEELDKLREIAKNRPITLLYGAKDPQINHAIVLKNVLIKS